MHRNDLIATVIRQQEEINGLRERVEALEAEDIGRLRSRVEELENWQTQAQEQIRNLEIKTAMTQGLTVFVGTSMFALLGEKVTEALNSIDDLEDKVLELAEEKRQEIERELGETFAKILDAIRRIDKMSLQAWQQHHVILKRRAKSLPPLKSAIYKALNQMASPSNVGSQLLNVLIATSDLSEKLSADEIRKVELLTSLLDTFSNIWPLTVTNSLAPMLKYVGYDEAAEAAGEILDQLEATKTVPRHLIHKVRPDLIEMGVIESRTKPDTIIEYLTQGFQLQQLGLSPDRAAELGHVASSATQLKRSKRALEGIWSLYNRTSEYPSDLNLDCLETFSQSLKRVAEEKVTEFRELLTAEFA